MKKFTPKKVFILQNGGYKEITPDEHSHRRENDEEYKLKKFIGVHSMIMEVGEKEYYDFYREKRKQKYIAECSKRRGDVSYDALTTDEFNGENVVVDCGEEVVNTVEFNLMTDRLYKAITELSAEEQKLIKEHFFYNIPQTELARMYGVNQSNISRRIAKILIKIKKLMKI